MELEELKVMLKSAERINFSGHSWEKMSVRGISKDEILSNLKNPDRLVAFEYQGEEKCGQKYALMFSKSRKYDLKIVVSVADKGLNVITSHIQNIKRRKVFEKWLKKLR